MRILGVIPVRGGSKGVPHKNIKPLLGKPLLEYTAEVAQKSVLISRLIVSTDDPSISACAQGLNIEVPFIRPAHLAMDDTPTLAVLQHALSFYADQDQHFDAICLLQVTSPFRTVDFLNSALHKFINHDFDSLISVQKTPLEFHPNWAFFPKNDAVLELALPQENIISRRQELPVAYYRDGSIYITKTDIIMNQNSLFGSQIGFIEGPPEAAINIDTHADWKRAEQYLKPDTI
tara:strand:- start:25 stop:723 length:699 start_codon:yes stop_codon:yes gene_type:complete